MTDHKNMKGRRPASPVRALRLAAQEVRGRARKTRTALHRMETGSGAQKFMAGAAAAFRTAADILERRATRLERAARKGAR